MSLVVQSDAPHLLVATWKNTVITVARGDMPLADLDAVDAVQRAVLAQHPGGLVALSIVPQGSNTGMPDAAFRRAAAEMTARWQPHFLGTVRVVELAGFAGSAIRGVMTGIDLVAQSRTPTSVFQRRDDAARWICALPRQPPEVRDAYDALRAALAGL